MTITNAKLAAITYAEGLDQSIGKAHAITEVEIPVNNWYIDKYTPNLIELVFTDYHYNPGYITIPCKVTAGFTLIK